MTAKRQGQEIITFKSDPALVAAMRGIPNRSEFIRAAILAALDGACPLCKGTGILTPEQRRHWDAFAADHAVKECDECHALHMVCTNRPRPARRAHPHS
ncbi:MAG TPA: CopG family transcriptional regulator [Planctomycetota bacterium]|nr:CopG family transcriptional regulator [Planctomycetota bacterium]HRR80847.1 CopG family transcriptional regulator [Planctomycetota bacterium]HRT95964.1 CopG family transcriptional regulator [Planctomycetota bacterium]